jgi:hypothetical protein
VSQPEVKGPGDVALAFLRALEARDLARAGRFLAPGVVMTFPGPTLYRDLDELVADATQRYRGVVKEIAEVEAWQRGPVDIVYVQGTLRGTNLHGVAFEGVRFLDRFEIAGGLIRRQDVWNDLAVSGVLERRE